MPHRYSASSYVWRLSLPSPTTFPFVRFPVTYFLLRTHTCDICLRQLATQQKARPTRGLPPSASICCNDPPPLIYKTVRGTIFGFYLLLNFLTREKNGWQHCVIVTRPCTRYAAEVLGRGRMDKSREFNLYKFAALFRFSKLPLSVCQGQGWRLKQKTQDYLKWMKHKFHVAYWNAVLNSDNFLKEGFLNSGGVF